MSPSVSLNIDVSNTPIVASHHKTHKSRPPEHCSSVATNATKQLRSEGLPSGNVGRVCLGSVGGVGFLTRKGRSPGSSAACCQRRKGGASGNVGRVGLLVVSGGFLVHLCQAACQLSFRIGRRQRVPDSSNHSLHLMKLFNSSMTLTLRIGRRQRPALCQTCKLANAST